MKCIFIILLLSFCLFAEDPPYHGTIFIEPGIITSTDPSLFTKLKKKKSAQRTMFDRRKNDWIKTKPYLFTAYFKDKMTMEVQVNPEFSEKLAIKEASKYLKVIGKLPSCLRKNVKTVWIHKGNKPFGGGNENLLIHTERGDDYIKQGILEETFFHEATHTSIDPFVNKNLWSKAQKDDVGYISKYAKQNPNREDLAESFLLYFALKYRPERISTDTLKIIRETIPSRIYYFDNQKLNMYPYKKSKLK